MTRTAVLAPLSRATVSRPALNTADDDIEVAITKAVQLIAGGSPARLLERAPRGPGGLHIEVEPVA